MHAGIWPTWTWEHEGEEDMAENAYQDFAGSAGVVPTNVQSWWSQNHVQAGELRACGSRHRHQDRWEEEIWQIEEGDDDDPDGDVQCAKVHLHAEHQWQKHRNGMKRRDLCGVPGRSQGTSRTCSNHIHGVVCQETELETHIDANMGLVAEIYRQQEKEYRELQNKRGTKVMEEESWHQGNHLDQEGNHSQNQLQQDPSTLHEPNERKLPDELPKVQMFEIRRVQEESMNAEKNENVSASATSQSKSKRPSQGSPKVRTPTKAVTWAPEVEISYEQSPHEGTSFLQTIHEQSAQESPSLQSGNYQLMQLVMVAPKGPRWTGDGLPVPPGLMLVPFAGSGCSAADAMGPQEQPVMQAAYPMADWNAGNLSHGQQPPAPRAHPQSRMVTYNEMGWEHQICSQKTMAGVHQVSSSSNDMPYAEHAWHQEGAQTSQSVPQVKDFHHSAQSNTSNRSKDGNGDLDNGINQHSNNGIRNFMKSHFNTPSSSSSSGNINKTSTKKIGNSTSLTTFDGNIDNIRHSRSSNNIINSKSKMGNTDSRDHGVDSDIYHCDGDLDDGEATAEGNDNKTGCVLLEVISWLDLLEEEIISCKTKGSDWERLKRVEHEWRTVRDNLKASDAELFRCMGKIFNVFDSQSAVLKCCLHDRLVSSHLAGKLAEAKGELNNIITVLDSLFTDASAPLGPICDEMPGGPDVVIAVRDYISEGSTSVPIQVGDLIQSFKKCERGWTYVRNLSLTPPNNVGWVPSWLTSTEQDRKLIGGNGECSKELRRKKKKSLKQGVEWFDSSNPKEDPELTQCLQKVYKNAAKCCLNIKNRLHALLQQRHSFQGALKAVECRVDTVLWRMDVLLTAVSSHPLPCKSTMDSNRPVVHDKAMQIEVPILCGNIIDDTKPVVHGEAMQNEAQPAGHHAGSHSVEGEIDDAEGFLFQAAHLDELVTALERLH